MTAPRLVLRHLNMWRTLPTPETVITQSRKTVIPRIVLRTIPSYWFSGSSWPMLFIRMAGSIANSRTVNSLFSMVVVFSRILLVPPFRRLFIYPLKVALLLLGLQLLFTSIRVEHTTHWQFTTRSLITETVFCMRGTPA